MKAVQTLIVVLVVLVFSPTRAGPVYDIVECTLGISCNIGSHGSSLGMGPSNADFQAFYSANLGVDLSGDTFAWSQASNGNGDTFGHVDDTDYGIHTAYLWSGSSMLCCTIDDPYVIVDGNDFGLFIGNDISFTSNAGQPVYPGFLAGAGGPFALTPWDYGLTSEARDFLAANNYPPISFVAIDDNAVILAQWQSGWLKFVPLIVTNPSVPEPAGVLLLLPALLLVRRFRRR
jgi:hypothetical protein